MAWSTNVGGLDIRSSFLDLTDDQWLATFELNFHAAVRMSRAAIPALLRHGGGSLVHVASEAARFPDTPLVDYAAAQFNLPPEQAIEHFVREVRGLPAGRFGTPTMSPE